VKNLVLFFVPVMVMFSCASYKANIMFKSTEGYQPEVFKRQALEAEKNYIIQKNDYLTLRIFSNNGERLIDPNPDMSGQNNSNNSQQSGDEEIHYLVDVNGVAKLPLVGEIKLEGLTLRQAEEIVQKEYSKFFKESFVLFSYVNKRVVVLGAPGGQVIPLMNQNIRVAEVLGMAKGLSNEARANNIKLIRGNHVYQIDFSTIKGYLEGNILVEAGDIIYIEPIRRPFTEGLKDSYIIISLLLTITNTAILIYSVTK
jgi:polysaccharide export outer membrane protein